jgi:WS/DGAT/MGAT family acyltransferase
MQPSARPTWDRLSPLDAAFLYFERPNQRLYVGCVALLEGPVSFDALVGALGARLDALAPWRRRPVRPPLDLSPPAWEADPDFDVRRHVRHVAAPPPGGERELRDLVDMLFATPFDRRHPLWETYLIDGLAGGRTAVLCKVHHCMIDGVSGAQVLEVLTDGSAEEAPAGGVPLAGHAGVNGRPGPIARAREALDALGAAARAVTSPIRIREGLLAASIALSFAREPAPTLPFNGALSDARRIVWSSFDLDDFLAIRGAAGCKVNDVVLAVITGALRRYLEGRGVPVNGLRVRALTPVNVRGPDQRLTLGNQVTAMFPWLPVGVADPVERLRRIAAEMGRRKERGDAQAAGAVLALAGALPAPLRALLGRLSPDRALFNTVCTNVPGPRETRWVLGRRVLEIHPIVPLFQGMGLEFAIMSYAGRLSIAATADPVLVPDAERLAEALRAAGAELRDAFAAPHAPAAAGLPAGPAVGELMTRDVVTLRADDSLATAYLVMRLQRIRHLPVVDGARHVIGLVTHRDLLAASSSTLDLPGEAERIELLARARAGEVMETHLSLARPTEDAADAGRRMIRHKIGCLPVTGDDRRLVGIVTEEDFLRWATEHMAPAAAPA